MKHLLRRRRAFVATALALALVACGGAPKPTQISASIVAGAGVNPDVRKRASPLVVRVYELRSSAAFQSADFLSLYDRDQATLAAEMSSREEFVLKPGETKTWEKTAGPDSKYVGVMAAFRDIEHARWKSIVELKPGAKNVLVVNADAIAVDAKRSSP